MSGFVFKRGRRPQIDKRPGEVLDYTLDLSRALGPLGVIATVSAVGSTGITVLTDPAPAANPDPLTVTLADDTEKTIPIGQGATVWLSGGELGRRYSVTVTTTQANSVQVIERTFDVVIVNT